MNTRHLPKRHAMSNINRAAGIIRAMVKIENSTHDIDVARALADAGLLAPDLPAKDEWDEVVLIPREGSTTVIKDIFTDTSYSIAGARMHALDLLAAADHAEEVGRADS